MFYKNDCSNRRIYVQGNPGSGKSTFAAKLVHDWCLGNQPLSTDPTENTEFDDLMTIQQFKFLFFFISLRDVRGQKDITQIMNAQLVDRMYSTDLGGVYELLHRIMETELCLVVSRSPR
ncbi:hypothetical protein DPMN_140300 [Dreissena polymorpha]|uniref:Uncharacterized protein n=1 Tax=Dreissena polymorpha TaxID=45954 RepID=A0A9D4G7H8_DREPO|nr:hypothetical protein DPMN_140300 [Dreissena polymorpha]